MKNNKIIHSVEQGTTINELIGIYKKCADKIGQGKKDEKLDLLPDFQEFAKKILPDSYREHFKSEEDWRKLESSYEKTCGSSPFVFKKKDESNLAGELERFKRTINENLYNNKNMWDDISLDVLGKPHYTVFISGVVLQLQGSKSSNEKIEANDKDNKKEYEKYLQEKFRGNNTPRDYRLAMEMIERNLHNFEPLNKDIRKRNLWNIEEIDSLKSILRVVQRDEKAQNGGAFKDEQATSYWKEKHCSAALKEYMKFQFGDDIKFE